MTSSATSGIARVGVVSDDDAHRGALSKVLRKMGYVVGPPGVSAEASQPHPFIFASPAMREVERTARQVADSDVTVLVTGESGTGKEVVARYVHRVGPRSRAPFVKINCAALPGSLLENELFGHERGAFTGAFSRQAGKFRTADHGVLFLDEISELSAPLQAKLLHVLEDKEFTQLGGSRNVSVDVKVIAATNRNLEKEVASGGFRKDLYYRLNVIELHLPPLRERRQDIPLLINHAVFKYAHQCGKSVPEFSGPTYEMLLSDPWPGNVRQLENVIRSAVILGDDEARISETLDVPRRVEELRVRTEPRLASGRKAGPAVDLKSVGQQAALRAEREQILRTLETTRWNRRKASRKLHVCYKTLLTKMRKLGLTEIPTNDDGVGRPTAEQPPGAR